MSDAPARALQRARANAPDVVLAGLVREPGGAAWAVPLDTCDVLWPPGIAVRLRFRLIELIQFVARRARCADEGRWAGGG